MYRVGGRAHAQGITFQSDVGRVTAYDGRADAVTVFSPRLRRFKAAMSKVPVLRVFSALGATGGALFVLMLLLLALEVVSPDVRYFDLSDRFFWAYLFALGLALIITLLLTRRKRRRLLQYHGAEHMAINTYRAGKPLTVENILQADRATPSCGSIISLIFLVVAMPLMFVPYGDYFMIIAFGVAFELSVLARRVKWLRWLLRFGMAAQRRIWTRQPDAAQIEVARRGLSALIEITERETQRN